MNAYNNCTEALAHVVSSSVLAIQKILPCRTSPLDREISRCRSEVVDRLQSTHGEWICDTLTCYLHRRASARSVRECVFAYRTLQKYCANHFSTNFLNTSVFLNVLKLNNLLCTWKKKRRKSQVAKFSSYLSVTLKFLLDLPENSGDKNEASCTLSYARSHAHTDIQQNRSSMAGLA